MNLIEVVFVLAFLCSLTVYIQLLSFMLLLLLLSLLSLLVYYILLVKIKELRVETHCVLITKLVPRVRSARRGAH